MRGPHWALFADIAWSTDTVAAQTRERAAALGLDLVELPRWYDIDDVASLDRLAQETSEAIPRRGRDDTPSKRSACQCPCACPA